MIDNGTVDQIKDRIDSSNTLKIFKDVIPDPPIENISLGVSQMLSIDPDVIIAFGGGSAIDTAKGIIYFAPEAGFKKKVNFIAIPTTSGTGSEVTSVTVITDKELKTKHVVISHDILPNEVILYPQFTVSVPPAITANTGMDVLTHVVEAYVAKNASSYSDALVEKGVAIVFKYLKKCYHNGQDLRARSKMQEASNIAGTAFNLAGLGMNHAIAHQLGGTFHIPHGLANTLVMNEVIKKNSKNKYMQSRYALIAHKLSVARSADSDEVAVEKFCNTIREAQIEMNMPLTISECNVDKNEFKSKLPDICENAVKDSCVAFARMPYSKEEVAEILLNIL